jgi:membrane protein implicated in regulation of membrane protease activity
VPSWGYRRPEPRSAWPVRDWQRGAGTVDPMFAAPVWHYWLGVAIFLPGLLVTVALIAQFLRKTQSPKYGRDD